MKLLTYAMTGLGAFLLAAMPAYATTLLDLVDAPKQDATPYTFTFTAHAPATQVSFAGYQVPDLEFADIIRLTETGSMTNLLAPVWAYQPAPTDPAAFQLTDTLVFIGGGPGSYDRFFQNVATTAGASYQLSFTYSNAQSVSASPTSIAPSGFRVEVSDVPEPATWAMMILGFSAVGFAARRRTVARYAGSV